MSETKLNKYLLRPVRLGTPQGQLVLLSDSKGRYLRNELHSFPEFNIHFEGRPGLRLFQGLYWLQGNISHLIECYGPLQLYIWLGTCDLTLKQKDKQLTLRWDDDDVCFQYIFRQIENYYSFASCYPYVKLVFLQVPP